MKLKKILAVVMSLCMVAGTVSYGAPVITQNITAQAAEFITETDCYSFDDSTGKLTIKGNVDGATLRKFNNKYGYRVKSVIAEKGTVLPKDSSLLFRNYTNCSSIDLSNADTSNVTNMCNMFENCKNLHFLDVSGFDTSKVTNTRFMFGGCESLTALDVSGFDTNKVTKMSGMFRACKSLKSLDLSGFDTSRVALMDHMFSYCESLTALDLSGFDTSKVESMDHMFFGCHNLTTLDLSSFDTRKITEKYSDYSSKCMFSSCNKLESLTLGENFKNVLKKAQLPNSKVWVNMKAPTRIVSGDDKFAVIKNNGKNTYITYTPTYPTNIKVEYSREYNLKSHQVRFSWKEVEGADRYAIAVYLAGKWKVQDKGITDTSYTTPKSMTPDTTYKVAIAARVDGKWDTVNAIKNAVTVTVK